MAAAIRLLFADICSFTFYLTKPTVSSNGARQGWPKRALYSGEEMNANTIWASDQLP
jgi:hypothetical protein